MTIERLLLTVQDRFDLGDKGLALAPALPVDSIPRQEQGVMLRVRLEMPDGAMEETDARIYLEHFNPGGYKLICYLQSAVTTAVPSGTKVWIKGSTYFMHSGQLSIPVFGLPDPAQECTRRVAAYAVITDPAGRIAAVRGKAGYFLPGGGSLPGETPEQTIRREVLEELAREVRLLYCIGEAVQHFAADRVHYRMEAVFYAAEFSSETCGAGEHELCWIEPAEVERAFYHQCHAWAAGQTQGSVINSDRQNELSF